MANEFLASDAANLLAACRRHCCVCLRWCGFRIELHHIVAESDGGTGDIENAIPVCFDCHAEIEAKGPRGRRYSAAELRQMKDSWLAICRERPDILVQASQDESRARPLEALLYELEYNLVVVSGPLDVSIPMMATGQFERAIATGALGALSDELRAEVFETYKAVGEANRLNDKMTHLNPEGSRSVAMLRATDMTLKTVREDVSERIPLTARALAVALGRSA